MALGHSPSIIVDGLIFHIDPNNPRCYSGSGNTIYNLVNPSIGGTFVGFTANPIDNTETRSLAYNGTSTYQEFYPIQPTRYTFSLWFKATGAPSHNDIYGGALYTSNPQYFGAVSLTFGYRWDTNRFLVFQNSPSDVSSASVPANKIVNTVCTYDGSNIKIYIDGLLTTTTAYTNDPSYPGSGNLNMKLGAWGYPSYERYFNGNIYQASIYNRALSASEILQNYNATRKKYYPEENIVSDGLVLHIDPSKNTSYPGTGNTIYDISGSGQTGTFTNGPTFSGLNGGYISFDGSNDYIDYPRSSLYDFGSSDFTIMYWINTTTKDTFNAVIDLNDAGGKMIIGTYNNLSWMWFTSSYNIVGTINLCDGIWHQATISRIGSTLTHYVDGRVSVSTNVGATVVPSNNFFSIGRLVQTSSYGQIKLADVKLYKNKGLTQQEISQNYNATKKRFVNALPPVRNNLILELDAASVSSYPGTGNTWYDLSGNNLNSSLAGSPTYTSSGSASYITFDANTKSGTLSTSVLNNYSSGTIECSVYITNLTSSFILARQRNGFNSYNVFSVGSYADGGGTLVTGTSGIVYYHNKNAQTVLSSSTALLANIWYRLTITFTTSAVILYINGVQNATVAGDYSVPNEPSTDPRIGAFIKDGTNYPMNGRLAHFTVYNRALSAYEVKQNFDYYRTRYGI